MACMSHTTVGIWEAACAKYASLMTVLANLTLPHRQGLCLCFSCLFPHCIEDQRRWGNGREDAVTETGWTSKSETWPLLAGEKASPAVASPISSSYQGRSATGTVAVCQWLERLDWARRCPNCMWMGNAWNWISGSIATYIFVFPLCGARNMLELLPLSLKRRLLWNGSPVLVD